MTKINDYIPEIDFDPNDMKSSNYATYRPRRTPAFKMHKNLGNARNAASNGGPAIIYEFKGGKWHVVEERFKNVACTICGEDIRQDGPIFVPQTEEVVSGVGAYQKTYNRTTRDKIVRPNIGIEISYYHLSNSDRGAHYSCYHRVNSMAAPIISKIERCIGPDTAVNYEENENSGNPWVGQCVPVSLVIQDELGGDILRSVLPNGESHYFNSIDGTILDGTVKQYAGIYEEHEVHASPEVRSRDYLFENKNTKHRYEILRGLYDII